MSTQWEYQKRIIQFWKSKEIKLNAQICFSFYLFIKLNASFRPISMYSLLHYYKNCEFGKQAGWMSWGWNSSHIPWNFYFSLLVMTLPYQQICSCSITFNAINFLLRLVLYVHLLIYYQYYYREIAISCSPIIKIKNISG